MTPDAEVTAAAEDRAISLIVGILGQHGATIYRSQAGRVWEALRDAALLADPNLAAERDRARDIAVALGGQVARVAALHHRDDDGTCYHCDWSEYPCPTVATLEGEGL